jgi:hypothetical protein
MAVDWETCDIQGCSGVRFMQRRCVVHAGQPHLLADAVQRGDFRGVSIDAGLMRAIFELVPTDDADRPTLTDARFTRAVFADDADFCGMRLRGDTSFERAEFHGQALFDGVEFDRVTFDGASFGLATSAVEATFGSVACFRDTAFRGTTELTLLTLGGGGDFSRAPFDLTVSGPNARAIHLDEVLCEGQIDARLAAAEITVSRTRLDRGGQIAGRISLGRRCPGSTCPRPASPAPTASTGCGSTGAEAPLGPRPHG